MADRKLRVEILGDASDLKRAAGEADGALGKMGGAFSKVAGGAALLGGGLATAGFAAFKFAEAAAEDERAAGALAKTLENSAGATREQIAATEEWISAQGRSLGVADDELRPALDRLVRATGDVGQAQKLASLAMDISAGTGKDLVTVSEALAKAQNGNLGALKKLDPALADLIKNTGSSELALESLAQTFDGQASAAADTAAGKLQIAKLQFAEMQEEIGAKLIPVLAKLADWFVTSVIPAIERLVAWVETNWPKFRQAIETGITAIANAWTTHGQPVLDRIIEAVNAFIGIAQALWKTFGDTILGYVKETWENIKLAIGGVLDIIGGIWETFAGLFSGDWGRMWDGIKQVFGGAWDLIKGLLSQALDAMKAAVSLAMDALGATIGNALSGIVQWFRELPGKIVGALANLGQQLMDLAGKALGVGVGFLGGLVGKLGELMTWFQELPTKILGWIGDIAQKFYDLGVDILTKLLSGLGSMLSKVKNKVQEILDALNPLDDIGGWLGFGGGGGIRAPGGGGTIPKQQSMPTATGRFSAGNVYVSVNADATTDTVALGRTLLETIESSMRAGVRPTMLQAA